MSQSEHGQERDKATPGPWRIHDLPPCRRESVRYIYAQDNCMVAHVSRWDGYPNDPEHAKNIAEAAANAHLIAAAPELLAACKAALQYFEDEEGRDYDGWPAPELRAAIAKATEVGT